MHPVSSPVCRPCKLPSALLEACVWRSLSLGKDTGTVVRGRQVCEVSHSMSKDTLPTPGTGALTGVDRSAGDRNILLYEEKLARR